MERQKLGTDGGWGCLGVAVNPRGVLFYWNEQDTWVHSHQRHFTMFLQTLLCAQRHCYARTWLGTLVTVNGIHNASFVRLTLWHKLLLEEPHMEIMVSCSQTFD